MQQDQIEKLLYNYKYSNVALQQTVISILETQSLPISALSNPEKEDLIREFAWKLVDYKFNRTKLSRKMLVLDIIKWLNDNQSALKAPAALSFDSDTWG